MIKRWLEYAYNLNKLQEKGLRIAWQYKKYFGENQQSFDGHRGKTSFQSSAFHLLV